MSFIIFRLPLLQGLPNEKPYLIHIPFTFRVRTSSGTFLARGRDKIVKNIEKRISDFTFIPVGKYFAPPVSFL